MRICASARQAMSVRRLLPWMQDLRTEAPQGGLVAVRTALPAVSRPLQGEPASPPGRSPNLTQTNNLMLMDKINLRILMRLCARETDSSSED